VKFREDVTPEGAKKPKYKYSKPNWKAMHEAQTDEVTWWVGGMRVCCPRWRVVAGGEWWGVREIGSVASDHPHDPHHYHHSSLTITIQGWDGVYFNSKGFVQTMALPGCFIKEDVKKMKQLFTEHLEVS
jgi:hypothetical protein